jgi:hypothetical protein
MILSDIEQDVHIPRSRRHVTWRPAGVVVTAIKDVMYPYDDAVVRAVRREFDPAIIPVMVLRAYKSETGELRIHRVHAIASHQPLKEGVPAWSERVLMPMRGRARPRPTHMDLHLEDRADRKGDGLPGVPLPFDWRVYYALRSLYQEWSAHEVARFERERGRFAVAARQKEAADERTAYIYKQDRRWLHEKVTNILTSPPEQLRKALLDRALRRQAMVYVKGVAS